MDGVRFTEEPPCLFSRKNENWSDQSYDGIEGSIEDGLGCAAPARIGSVAIHSILGNIHVKAAEIYSTKLVHPMVNLVKFILLVRLPTLLNKLLKSRGGPSIDQSKIRY